MGGLKASDIGLLNEVLKVNTSLKELNLDSEDEERKEKRKKEKKKE